MKTDSKSTLTTQNIHNLLENTLPVCLKIMKESAYECRNELVLTCNWKDCVVKGINDNQNQDELRKAMAKDFEWIELATENEQLMLELASIK